MTPLTISQPLGARRRARAAGKDAAIAVMGEIMRGGSSHRPAVSF
jgi:hypothetical protein